MGTGNMVNLKKQGTTRFTASVCTPAGRLTWRDALTSLGLLSCLMTLCASAYAAPPTGSSGVKGRITLSPACGGPPREGEDCQAPYAQVEIRLLNEADSVMGQTRTSAQGLFQFAAVAGRYRLQVMPAGKMTRCPIVYVQINANTVASVDVDCDSGMR